jgi:hypothetical protein
MDHPLLNDPSKYPNEQVLARQLGKAKPAWSAFLALLKKDYSRLRPEWRYSNEGKSWLCQVTCQATTVCRVAVWDKFFTVAFRLNTRDEDLVRASSLGNDLKQGFLHPAEPSKLRAVRVEVRKITDLNAVDELIEIKLKAK